MAQGIDELTIDTVCIDEQDCASLAGTFNLTTAWTPRGMSTNIASPNFTTPVVTT